MPSELTLCNIKIMYGQIDDHLPLLTHMETLGSYAPPIARVSAVLKKLCLPEPQGGEYYITNDDGYLIFLTPQGCTLRISDNRVCPPVEHHRLLKPLVRFDLDTHRVDVNPGLKLMNSVASSIRMVSIFARSGLLLDDPAPRNCGIIPAKCTGSLFSYTVVCDDGAFQIMSQKCAPSVSALFRLIAANDNKNNDIQERAYKPLRQAFAKALASETPEDMKAAWKLCAQKKAAGHLRSDWENPPEESLDAIKYTARRYAPRLADLTR